MGYNDDVAGGRLISTSDFIYRPRCTLPLARLVIPELREGTSSHSTNPHKQFILKHTESERIRLVAVESATPADFDTPLYRQEKHIFYKAEQFRAGLVPQVNNRLIPGDTDGIILTERNNSHGLSCSTVGTTSHNYAT